MATLHFACLDGCGDLSSVLRSSVSASSNHFFVLISMHTSYNILYSHHNS